MKTNSDPRVESPNTNASPSVQFGWNPCERDPRDIHACEWCEITIYSLCVQGWFCLLVDTWSKLLLRAICISVLGAPGSMVNPKDLSVVPRAPCAHNILVISHQLIFFYGCPSLSNATTFLNVIRGVFFPFQTQSKSFIIHYLSPGRKLPLEVDCWRVTTCLFRPLFNSWKI